MLIPFSVTLQDKNTNTSGAIDTAARDLFTSNGVKKNGDRDDIRDVIVVMTDGESTIRKHILASIRLKRKIQYACTLLLNQPLSESLGFLNGLSCS